MTPHMLLKITMAATTSPHVAQNGIELNRSALKSVLAQGASNSDIAVYCWGMAIKH